MQLSVMNGLPLELSALAIGGILSWFILRNPKTQQTGIGPRTLQALALSLLTPIVFILGFEKVLSSETVAAILGGLIGYAVPKSKDP